METIHKEQNFKIYFGEDFLKDLQQIFLENKVFPKRVLLMTGQKSFSESIHYHALLSLIKEGGFEILDRIKIRPNPLETELSEMMQNLTSEQIDLIIAIGGGSVIDAAKFIKHHLSKNTTILAVYTLPGSATIVTPFSIYDNHEFKIGFADKNLIPELSYVNSSAIDSLSFERKSIAVADIFSHAIESLCSLISTEDTKKDALIALEILVQSKIENLSAKDLIKADVHAGLSERVGLVLFPHAAGHYLTYKFGVPHSIATMFFLNEYLQLLVNKGYSIEEKYIDYAIYLHSLLTEMEMFPEINLSSKDIRDLLELSKRYMGFAYENAPTEISDAEYSMILEKYA